MVNDPVNPLARRVATHLAAIDAVLAAHEMVDGQRTKYWACRPTMTSSSSGSESI